MGKLFTFATKGFDKVIRNAFKTIASAPPLLARANEQVLDEFLMGITKYPPETPGNKPPAPYWARSLGLVNRSGVLDPLSELLGGHLGILYGWKKQVNTTQTGSIGRVSTDVSYAPWVIGSETQSRIHRKNKWPKVDLVLQKMGLGGIEINMQKGALAHYANAAKAMVEILKRDTKR